MNHLQDAPQAAQQSELLRDALQAYETAQAEAPDESDQILPNLVQTILHRPVDYLTYVEFCASPVAVVNGLIFWGEAENPYDLKGGWLCVRTAKNGWRDVHSLEHLGQVAKQYRLAMVAS